MRIMAAKLSVVLVSFVILGLVGLKQRECALLERVYWQALQKRVQTPVELIHRYRIDNILMNLTMDQFSLKG